MRSRTIAVFDDREGQLATLQIGNDSAGYGTWFGWQEVTGANLGGRGRGRGGGADGRSGRLSEPRAVFSGACASLRHPSSGAAGIRR